MRIEQLDRIHNGRGFIAALDQSGGSTPKALQLYGVDQSQYTSEEEMFSLIHQMRTRIIANPYFNNQRILATILFEETIKRSIDSMNTAEYLWQVKGIPSFLKIDNGLADESNGVRLMKAIPQLVARCELALQHKVIGTKMRSVIKMANPSGIAECLRQQFDLASTINSLGLLPIVEPEVDIESPEKLTAEELLFNLLTQHLNQLPADSKVVLKLTLPEKRNLYLPLVEHPRVARVVALSGGYSQEVATAKLQMNLGVIASFSRALTEGLHVDQSEEEFSETLDKLIEKIYRASVDK